MKSNSVSQDLMCECRVIAGLFVIGLSDVCKLLSNKSYHFQ